MESRTNSPNITPVMSGETLDLITQYLNEIQQSGALQLLLQRKMGRRLYEVLKESKIDKLTVSEFVDALLKTTRPLLFAEKLAHAKGDGSDWTTNETMLLGRIARVVKDVTVYSKRTYNPTERDFFAENERPQTTLLFMNGALLVGCKADYDRVVSNGHVDLKKFEEFLEENVLPSLLFANQDAGKEGAVVTLPVLGGGEFAGGVNSLLSKEINASYLPAMTNIIKKNKAHLPHIKAVVITGFNDSQAQVNNTTIYTTKDSVGLYPQGEYQGLEKCKVYTGIAGDHLSFPGNDGYAGSPATHEGGTCTRTNVYEKITGVEGNFVPSRTLYIPPQKYNYWLDVCTDKQTTLNFNELYVCQNGACHAQSYQHGSAYEPQYLDSQKDANYHERESVVKFSDLAEKARDNSLRVRATLGNIIKQTLGLDENIEVKIETDGSVNFIIGTNDDKTTIQVNLETGLNLLKSYLQPYEGEFKNQLNQQDVIEHLLLIGLEEMVGKNNNIGYCSIQKPSFDEKGDLVYISRIAGVVIGIDNLLKLLTNVNKNHPLLVKIVHMQGEKNNAFYNNLLSELHNYIKNETWTSKGGFGIFEKTYDVCLANGDNPRNLPGCVKDHWEKLGAKGQKPPKLVFLEIKESTSTALKKQTDRRDPKTTGYYSVVTLDNDAEIYTAIKNMNGVRKQVQEQDSTRTSQPGK